MRQDSAAFALANTARTRSPRFVVSILFDVASIYITSKPGIVGVPGVVLQGVLEKPSAISQSLVPDEGRSEIGSFSFSIVDRGGVLTAELKAKLDSGRGLRGRTVQFWVGYEGMAFSEFQLFQTQVVTNAAFAGGRYEVRCQDITRQQRKEIFEPVFTTLRQSITASDVTVPVYDTAAFIAVAHGASFSDAPNQTVYYFKLEEEIIRATGKTADTFTGCVRGVLNSRAVPHAVDAATSSDRRTKVTEHIYLEMPAIKLAYAILTGQIYGTANVLPAHWHLGISPALVRLANFIGVGADLWDLADDLRGFVVQFVGLGKQDGKRFLEKELYLPSRCFSPIYSDGAVGLRRMARVLRDAVGSVRLTRKQITKLGDLEHDLDGMHNHFRVNWAFDGKDYRRASIFQDNDSIATHGRAPIKAYDFRGIYGARHTDAYVLGLLDGLHDSYGAPPQRIKVSVQGSLNPIEVGDVVRIQEPNLRDFAGPAGGMNRAFLVLNKQCDFYTGDVDLSLFGSTVIGSALSSTDDSLALPDVFYTSQGVALSTVCTIVSGVVQIGTYAIGGASTGTIYYHDGDLTVAQGAVFQLSNNAQIRVRGYLTINGEIDGNGRGHAGVADVADLLTYPSGTPGFVGETQGSDGMWLYQPGGGSVTIQSRPAKRSDRAQHDLFPYLDIGFAGGALTGVPLDLRGTSGGPGWKVSNDGGLSAIGGAGGAGGSGLVIVCRGLGFGASGRIDLSGGDGSPGILYTTGGNTYYSGGGAPGLSGGLLILLDGTSVSVPDVAGRFFGSTGMPGYAATHAPAIETFMDSRAIEKRGTDLKPFAGWPAPEVTHLVDSSNAMHRIQYIPAPKVAVTDAVVPVLPVESLAASAGAARIEVQLGIPAGIPGWVEARVYSSIDNNRANAVLVWQGRSDRAFEVLGAGANRWYWATMFDTVRNYESAFFPLSASAGVLGVAGAGGTNAITARLSNDAHTLAADSAGNVPSYAGAEGVYEIKVGATDVSGATSFAVVSNPQSLAVQLNTVAGSPVPGQPAGFYRVTGGLDAGEGSAALVMRATYLGVNYDATFSISKASAGAAGTAGDDGDPGADARLLYAYADRLAISYDSAGAISPVSQPTTFALSKQNLTSATVTVALTDAAGVVRNANSYLVGSGAVNPGGNTFTMTGATIAMSAANFDAARNGTGGVFVVITHADGVSTAASVVKTQDGAAGAPGIGVNGERGSKQFYAAGGAWSNATADSAIGAAGLVKVFLDAVTISNGSTFAETRYWSGSAWTPPGVIIDGNLVAIGTILANRLNVAQLSAITASIGLLRTATTGQRVEIEDNQIRVYDTANVLRVRMGAW